MFKYLTSKVSLISENQVNQVLPNNFGGFSNKLLPLLFAILAFIYQSPYFLWNQPPYLYRFVLFITLIVSFLNLLKNIDSKAIIVAFCFFFSWFVRQYSSNGLEFWFSSEILLIIVFLLSAKAIQRDSFQLFINIYTLVMVPSILMYVLIFFGFDLHWTYLEPLNPLKTQLGLFYREYFGMVILSHQIFPIGLGEVFRLSGVYDEPGVVGTVSVILLTATNFSTRKWQGKVLLISGLLSFSLAFYLISAMFFCLKKPFYLLVSISLFIVFVVFAPSSFLENDFVERYFIGRVITAVTDFDSANNREAIDFKLRFKNFLDSENLLFGVGRASGFQEKGGSASYKVSFFMYGVFGVLSIFIYYLSFVLVQIEKSSDLFLLAPFLICCLASLAQRPTFDAFWFIVIFFGGIVHVLSSSESFYIPKNRHLFRFNKSL